MERKLRRAPLYDVDLIPLDSRYIDFTGSKRGGVNKTAPRTPVLVVLLRKQDPL